MYVPPISPAEYERRVTRALTSSDDHVQALNLALDVSLECLKSIGYGAGVGVIEMVQKEAGDAK